MTFCPFGGKTFLDIGTGSGILAIYAKKQGAKYVLGIDIDPISIENAVDNARLNEVEVEYRVADAFEISGSFDIVCANLVTDLLINLKDRLLSLCNEFLIMSGVPFEDYDKIERAFGTPTMAMFGEGWVSFLFRHA
jgi:ribosomal protein L11 methyltransferase